MANEKLSYEIAALYTGQPAIKSAFDDFAKLNAAGAKVTRELDTLAKQSQKTGEALRNSRQGTAQLGMQFNQLGTQIASGTSAATAFAQQIGDVGYALTFMDGRLGAVGRFLAGPWGAAIGLAAVALGPYIARLMETTSSLNQVGDAIERVNALQGKSAAVQLAEAQIKQNKMREDLLATEDELAKRQKNMPGVRHYKQEQAVWNLRQGLLAAGEETRILQERLDKLNEPVKVKKTKTETPSGGSRAKSTIDEAEKEAKKKERELQQQMDKFKTLSGQMQEMFTIEMSPSPEIGRAVNALKDFNEQIKEIESLPGGSEFVKQFGYQIDTVRGKLEAATIQTEFFMGKIPETTPAVVEAVRAQLDAFDALGNSVDDAFKQMLTAGGSWRDGMKSIIQSVIDQLWKMYVTQQIVGMITGAISGLVGGGMPTTSQIMANSNSILAGMTPMAPGFANGTNNAPGGMAWVGERGPELVNLPRGSQVIPAHRASQMSGGGVTVNVDARGSADPAAVRAQVQQGILEAAPAIIAAAESRTISSLRRPRLGGAVQ